jgi:hypothetical protein
MTRVMARLSAIASQRGFSLVEVLVGGVVLVVGLIAISQFFVSAAARVLESDIRTTLHQVASEEVESIRGMDYQDVGTTNGNPQGTLLENEDREVGNLTVHIQREVLFWTDDSYEDGGPYPANYRRVTVTVSAVGRDGIDPVELVTNVAGGVDGGTLDITVTNVAGEPVENAQIAVTNTHLVPNVNIFSSAIRTNSEGKIMIPGLEPDSTTGYVVTASKAGYNTDYTDPGVVVVDGLPYTVVQLIIDELSTMVIKVVDPDGNEVEGYSVRVTGPGNGTPTYEKTIVSAIGGVTLAGICYSTAETPYLLTLVAGQGYDEQTVSWALDPGTTQEVTITLGAQTVTTTTSSTSSTSTTIGGTPQVTLSTSVASGSGTITVSPSLATYDQGSVVTISATPSSGYTFSSWGGDAGGTTNPVSVTLNTSKTVTAWFEAIPGSLAMTVTYMDHGNEKKVKNAEVRITLRVSPYSTYHTTTAANGVAFFDGLAPGSYTYSVVKGGFVTKTGTVTVAGATTMTVVIDAGND